MLMRRPDAVDDEAVTGRAVEQHEQAREEEQQRHEQREQLVQKPPRPVFAKPHPRRFAALGGDSYVGHQKAWPSETVTANGPSPFCRLSGTPKSTRIGPKLE